MLWNRVVNEILVHCKTPAQVSNLPNLKFRYGLRFKTRLYFLDTNISPDRLSLTPQAFTRYFIKQPFCVIHNNYKLVFIYFYLFLQFTL